MNESRISAAVASCLSPALQSDRPFSYVKIHLERLRQEPNWTEEDIVEVQTRVIRLLMQRLGTSQPSDRDNP